MLIVQILDKLGVFYDDLAKKAHGKTPDITYGELVTRIVGAGNCSAHTVFPEIGEQTFNRMMRKLFPDIRLNGGNQTWFYYLCSLVEHKYCAQCGTIKAYMEFHRDSSSSSGRSNTCKKCTSINKVGQYAKYKESHIKSYDKNYGKIRARNSRAKAERALRIPKWADLTKIEEFYSKCPEGYHVDHVIPLRGKYVSGLHVENNLQYLTAEDNLKKSNHFSID